MPPPMRRYRGAAREAADMDRAIEARRAASAARTVSREEFDNAARIIRATSRDARGRPIENLATNRLMEWQRAQEAAGRRIPAFRRTLSASLEA